MSYLHYLCLFAYSGFQDILFFSLFCVPYVASFSGVSIFDFPLKVERPAPVGGALVDCPFGIF